MHLGCSVFRGPPARRTPASIAEVRKELAEKFHPAAFNIGVNDGTEAGQTAGHEGLIPFARSTFTLTL